jgi:hypothetical protein
VSVLISDLTVLLCAIATWALDARTIAAIVPTTNRFICPPDPALTRFAPAGTAEAVQTACRALRNYKTLYSLMFRRTPPVRARAAGAPAPNLTEGIRNTVGVSPGTTGSKSATSE